MTRCNCEKTIKLLKRLGARHAARMHERGASKNPNQWSGLDWINHMNEEELLLFPLMIAKGARSQVALLKSHHAIFRADIRKHHRIINIDLMEFHSRIEDDLVERLGLV